MAAILDGVGGNDDDKPVDKPSETNLASFRRIRSCRNSSYSDNPFSLLLLLLLLLLLFLDLVMESSSSSLLSSSSEDDEEEEDDDDDGGGRSTLPLSKVSGTAELL
jgi:hypothetical protein